jgi:hypothetical protein
MLYDFAESFFNAQLPCGPNLMAQDDTIRFRPELAEIDTQLG